MSGRKHQTRSALKTALLVVLVGVGLIGLVLGLLWADPWLTTSSDPILIALNLLPVLLAFALVFGISRRVFVATLATALLLVVCFATNAIKLQQLEQPFVLNDVFLGVSLLRHIDLFILYIPWFAALGILVLLAILALTWWREPPRMHWLPGFFLLAIAVFGGYSLAQSDWPTGQWFQRAGTHEVWVASNTPKSVGLLASLIVDASRLGRKVPEPDLQAIDELRELPQFAEIRPARLSTQPDIVLLLSESYIDTSIVQHVAACESVPAWCEIRAQGAASMISVPAYGGGTIRTEFEVLTGVDMATLEGHRYPYLTAVNDATDSIAWRLLEQGYETTATHPNAGVFWSRNQVMPLLGMQRFLDVSDYPHQPLSGYYRADSLLTEQVIGLLEGAQRPQFVFGISMENHGPWGNRPNLHAEQLADIPVPPQLDEGLARQWRQYVYHLRSATTALEELNAYIQQRQRPTLIVFFGDHLPALGDVFKTLGLTEQASISTAKTPVLALANYELPAAWRPTDASGVGLWALDQAGAIPDATPWRELLRAHQVQGELGDDEVERFRKGALALQHMMMHRHPDLTLLRVGETSE